MIEAQSNLARISMLISCFGICAETRDSCVVVVVGCVKLEGCLPDVTLALRKPLSMNLLQASSPSSRYSTAEGFAGT
jgi:hypothetical protein